MTLTQASHDGAVAAAMLVTMALAVFVAQMIATGLIALGEWAIG
ncbi:hypothetical protein [Sphingomonas adhaesiva]